jgi:hypothetical protein
MIWAYNRVYLRLAAVAALITRTGLPCQKGLNIFDDVAVEHLVPFHVPPQAMKILKAVSNAISRWERVRVRGFGRHEQSRSLFQPIVPHTRA